ncbi:hypothetical protein [Frondihabitans australicus]|uniref:Uncharacterized protein n=1 Tax=Frondihabitans australicus TaxID=386892 RepID=A0A495IKD1_9MICO|nr:hypothetical protein [Frondihabitans australicus]RKR75751.1 hypothetical protein C8E83_2906 [Frondihabitans australicus]
MFPTNPSNPRHTRTRRSSASPIFDAVVAERAIARHPVRAITDTPIYASISSAHSSRVVDPDTAPLWMLPAAEPAGVPASAPAPRPAPSDLVLR